MLLSKEVIESTKIWLICLPFVTGSIETRWGDISNFLYHCTFTHNMYDCFTTYLSSVYFTSTRYETGGKLEWFDDQTLILWTIAIIITLDRQVRKEELQNFRNVWVCEIKFNQSTLILGSDRNGIASKNNFRVHFLYQRIKLKMYFWNLKFKKVFKFAASS